MRGFESVLLIAELMAERARDAAAAIAVRSVEGLVSYGDLDRAANRVAHLLLAQGAGPEEVVALDLPRGPRLFAAILGCLKAGAAYLAMDPSVPVLRRERMRRAAGVRIELTGEALAGLNDWPVDAPPSRTHPDNLAYVVFTSGSTGEPKPVAVTHRALVNHAVGIAARYRLVAIDRVLQFANPAFDVFAEELFPTLLSGAGIVVLPEPSHTAPTELERFADVHGVTLVNVPTPYWARWAQDLELAPRELPASVRLVVIGSDSADTATLRRWQRLSGVPIVNAYGLSETTITVSTAEFVRGSSPTSATVPIGEPIPGVRLHVLDAGRRPVDPGVVGEVYVEGAALARGYHRRAGLTAERFVPSADGARLYRTGDLGRRDDDGTLELVGRADRQTKIRGYRVDPAEVELALLEGEEVGQAHVGRAGVDRLVGYVVARDPARPPPVDVLRERLGRTLPAHMVPAELVIVDAFPLDARGKVDQRALESMGRPRVADAPRSEPSGETAGIIAGIWRETLAVEAVGLNDNFFDLGGHSLLVLTVHRRLMTVLGRDIPLIALFQFPTVHGLAAHLSGAPTDTDVAPAPAQGGRSRLLQQRARRQRQ